MSARKPSGIEKDLKREIDLLAELIHELPELRYWTAMVAYGGAYSSDPADIVVSRDGSREALRQAEKALARAVQEVRKAHGLLFKYGSVKP